MKADRLATWIRKLRTDKALEWRLVYGDIEGSYEELGRWDHVGTEGLTPDDARKAQERLAETMAQTAQWHCDELRQPCRYRLQALDDGGNALMTVPLLQHPDGAMAYEGVRGIEDATGTGVTAQMIRHSEVLLQTLLKGFQVILAAQNEQLARQTKMVADYQAQEGVLLEGMRELMLHTDGFEEKATRARRMDELVSSLVRDLGPALLTKLGVLPGAAPNGAGEVHHDQQG